MEGMDGGGDLCTSQAAKEPPTGNENGGEASSESREIECVQNPSDGQKGKGSSDRGGAEAEEVSFDLYCLI